MSIQLRSMAAIVRKDVAIFLRRPISIVVAVAPPLILLLVLFISAGAVGRNPVALVVEKQRPQAQRFASVLEASDAFRVVTANPGDADRMLANLEVAAVITIPSDFDDRLAAGMPDPVTIRINNLNLDFTNDLRRSLSAAITSFYAGQGGGAVGVRVDESDLRSADISLMQFELVPNLVLLLLVTGTVNCGMATALEFESQTIKELLLAPIPRSTVIAGKLLAGWIVALLVAAVILLIGAATGLLRPQGWYWVSTLVVVPLIALASAGIGAAVGLLAKRTVAVAPIAINLSIWLFFLSGGIAVAAFLPEWLQNVARLTPTYYGVHALQMSVFYGSADLLSRDVGVLFATAAFGVAIGAVALRKRTTG